MNFKTEVDSPGTRARAISPLRFYAGLFLITACTLMLQVVQTRILSVVAWYHLAFFAISMAMFGLTAGAVWLYLRRDRFTDRTLSYDLSYYSAAYALAIGLCFLAQMTLAPIMVRSMSSIWTWAELPVCHRTGVWRGSAGRGYRLPRRADCLEFHRRALGHPLDCDLRCRSSLALLRVRNR